MRDFLEEAKKQNHPLRPLQEFLSSEEKNEQAEQYDRMRFVGYVLEIGYDTVTIITSDPYKEAVGGIPRNSLLIMVPASRDRFLPHFTLLRVLESAPTPLSTEVQQTYFELQKKSMPELDVFTQSELQWGALKTGVLGMFYPNPESGGEIEFSGDINNFVSAHRYRVYAPDDDLLNLVVNALVPIEDRFHIGELRLTENRLPLPNHKLPEVKVFVSTKDFIGARTAMFGKTRLGKSNIVKLIAESVIDTTRESKNVGQLIFDIDGEYANNNPQDGSLSLAGGYPIECQVYALTEKTETPSKPLLLDFYEHPESSHRIIATLLRQAGRDSSDYINSFLSVDIPPIEQIKELPEGENKRAKRKVLMYWSILHRAGYKADIAKLRQLIYPDPEFNKEAREIVYGTDTTQWPRIDSLDKLAKEFEDLAESDRKAPLKSSTPGKDLFDPNDRALLGFLKPLSTSSTGPSLIQRFRNYHSPEAGDFVREIIKLLDEGKTVILDLGNAPPEVMEFFSDDLSRAIFARQVDKFSNNKLGNHFVQMYFEEAHNLFPARDADAKDIYRRIAKEGAKYHIGMVYSTQSVTTVNKDLVGQTENFFIVHLSSKDEVDALARVNVAYESFKDDILRAKTRGYVRMLTSSHRFVVSVQARKFVPPQGG